MSMFCTKNSVWAPSFDMRGRPHKYGLIIDEKKHVISGIQRSNITSTSLIWCNSFLASLL
jgi:hypothetical protein